MSADLHLYVVTGAWPARDLVTLADGTVVPEMDFDDLARATGGWDNPNVWIGQVSWMKASMDGDRRWIPPAVDRIAGLYSGGRLLTRGLALDTLAALNFPDSSYYGRGLYLTQPDLVRANWRFNRRHRGPGGFRAVTCRPRGVTRDRRGVKRWLDEHIGEPVIACSM